MDEHRVPYHEIKPSPEDILREIGYGDAQPGQTVTELVHRLLDRLADNVQPRYACLIADGLPEAATAIRICGQTLHTGPIITRLLEKSTSFAIFAATAGREFEQIAREYSAAEDILANYLLDIMGTAIVERTGDYLEARLEESLPGMLHTHRFSPGYCNWHLMEQRKIFALLGHHPCGITLSEVCLMHPIKSISGIIGIGTQVQPRVYACQYCELETCYKRKK
jgi:hypothetical protein